MLQSKHPCILPQHIVICIRPADDCCSGHLLRVAYRKSMVQNPWGAAQAAGRDELQVLVSWSSFEEFTESTNSCRWDERGISEPTRPDDEARLLNQLFQTDIERACVEPGRPTALTDASQLCWQVLFLLVGMLSMPQATLTCLLFTWACSTNYWPHTWACSVYHLGGVATLHLLTPFKACFKCVYNTIAQRSLPLYSQISRWWSGGREDSMRKRTALASMMAVACRYI